jgi:malate dehydrogenase (oxaloacetate-decarboxylating)(NADP+)
LGDIGPEASKPVMEGKGLLFKIFADIDVFDIEIGTKDIEEFIQTVKYFANFWWDKPRGYQSTRIV